MSVKSIFASLFLMVANLQTIWAQKVVLHPTGKEPIEYEVAELDSITFVDEGMEKEVRMAVLNIFNDTDYADVLILCDDGSYILCDGKNSEGYGVLYMNASIDNDFEEGITIFLNENETPVMASTSDGHFIFQNVTEDSFDFAYINNEDEISLFYNVGLDVQGNSSLSTRKRSILDSYIGAFYYDGHFQWDDHNKLALMPFVCKIISFGITAAGAVKGEPSSLIGLLHTTAFELYKSSDYQSDFLDELFYGTGMTSLSLSGIDLKGFINSNGGNVVFTPKKLGLAYLAYWLNEYGDRELEKMGQYNERVIFVYKPEEWKIRLSTNLLECQPDDEKFYHVDVSSKSAWDIDESQIDHTWCEATKLDYQVAIYVTPNNTGYDRSCSLKVYSKTVNTIEPVTLTIKQLGKQSGIVFELSEGKLSFTQYGGSKGVSVTTNENIESWDVTSYPSWCKIEKGNYSFFVSADKNAGETRTGTITVTALTREGIPVDRYLSVEQIITLCPDDNHPHAIDLGLPSGTKWCCCNVGASTPEGYGGYYAWGETSTKSNYDWDTYKYYKDTGEEWGYTKYCTWSSCGYNGFTDGKKELDASDDAATVNMGAPWRMPSTAQQQEFISNCSLQWTQQNGVNGILVTGRNGGQIFLPAAGGRGDGELDDAGTSGYYWSSSLSTGRGNGALIVYLTSGYWHWSNSGRRYGFSVRAVRP